VEPESSERFLQRRSVLRLRVESLRKLVAPLFIKVEVAVQSSVPHVPQDLLPVPLQENIISKT
jgi:hypothetical protein